MSRRNDVETTGLESAAAQAPRAAAQEPPLAAFARPADRRVDVGRTRRRARGRRAGGLRQVPERLGQHPARRRGRPVGPQPPKYTNAENILLIGSDTRVGQHGIGGRAAGQAAARTP